jgi:hypothetical protein
MSSSWYDMKRYRHVGFGDNHEKAFLVQKLVFRFKGIDHRGLDDIARGVWNY